MRQFILILCNMRKVAFLLLCCIGLMAMTPVHSDYENEDKIDDEFSNLYEQAQPVQFIVRNSTPILGELQDGQVIIVSSHTYVKFMFRVNQEIYAVNASCVTIRR